ncbi:MAG: nucleotidyltransferase domain-containing protein [Candidatus Nanoarchaeia archaeon]
MNHTLPKKYQDALDLFVKKYKDNKNILGIFLTGSFIHSLPDKNSDLDVYIILKQSYLRERGNTWINGIEIEYFINPVKQIEYYFKTESIKGAPCTAHMFVNSIILFQRDNTYNKLKNKAEIILNKKRKSMNPIEKELSSYQIDDLEKDLEDVYLKKDWFAFNRIAIEIIQDSLEIFYKIKRINTQKPKRLLNYLDNIDPRFALLYKNAVLEKETNKKYNYLVSLIRYLEKMLGGKRKKEWKLKTKCTYLKK